MNTHDIELPPEFQSGNSVPVSQATIKRERMIEILQAAIKADRQRRGEPVARVNDDGFIVETGLGLAPGTLLYTAQQPDDETTARIGAWLSAALDDPAVCQEMKGDIRAWFKAGQPNVKPTVTATLQDAELIADDRNVDMALAFFAETPIKRQAIEVVQAVMQAVSKELWLNPIDGSHPAEPVVKESLTVPDGWQLVPIKPTEAMLNQGESEWSSRYEANRGYRAMLQAAPTYSGAPKHLQDMNKSELIDLIESERDKHQIELDAIGAGEW